MISDAGERVASTRAQGHNSAALCVLSGEMPLLFNSNCTAENDREGKARDAGVERLRANGRDHLA